MSLGPPVQELFQGVSPFSLSIEEKNSQEDASQGLLIKGFASVELEDRSGDFVDPLEFDIDEFIASPTLMINHDFWIDQMGNPVAIGSIKTVNAARVVKNDDDDSLWNIKDLKSKEIISTFPKKKVPSMKRGMRGLFVTARVTIPEVIKQIERGELSGMSWRGLVKVEDELDPETHTIRKTLKEIDLWEVSVVHIQDNRQSRFVVGKTTAGKFEEIEDIPTDDVRLWKVHLPKSFFVSKGMAEEYLKAHRLDSSNIREDQDSYWAQQYDVEKLNIRSSIRFKMGAAYLFMASPNEDTKEEKEIKEISKNRTDFIAELITQFSDKVGNTSVSTESKKMSDAEKTVEGVEKEEEKLEETVSEKVVETSESEEKEKTDSEKSFENLGSHVAGSVATALKPTLEAIGSTMVAISKTLEGLTEKSIEKKSKEKKSEEKKSGKEETSKSGNFSEVLDVLSSLAEKLQQTEKEVIEVAKSTIALGASIPNEGVTREETVVKEDVSKSIEDADKNAVLDSAFPFQF